MATDNEMRAAGIHLPAGGDYISDGDDAITENARVLWERIEGARGFLGNVTTGDTLDSLKPGGHWVPDAAEARALGLPEELQGSVHIAVGANSENLRDAVFISRKSPPRMYFTTKFSAGWTDWQQVAVHQPGSTRTTAFALNHPRGMDSESGRDRQYRVPFKLGARARLKRVAFRNYDYNSDTPGVGQVELRNVGLGLHNLNADGSMSGRFIEGSTVETLLAGTVTAPDDHYVFHSDDVDLEIEPHKEYLLSYAYAADETMTVRRQLGQCFMNGILGSWDSTSQTVTATPQSYMGLHVWLELEVDADTPVWAYIGDSQLSGLSTSRPAHDSWARVHAYSNGAIPQILAHPGGSLAEFLDPDKRALRMWDHLDRADRAYIAGLGSNDISNGRPFTGMQEYFGTVAQNVREKFSSNLYLTTTLPRTGPNDTDPVRDAYNAWLLTLPASAIEASDHFAAVLDPVTGFTDERWQGPGGDVHLNTAGNARLAQATDGLVTRTSIVTPPAPPSDFSVDIPLTADWRPDVSSSVTAYRTGNVVMVAAWRLAAVDGDATDGVDAYTLPPGYRPAGLTQQYTRDSRGRDVSLTYSGRVAVTDPMTSVAHHSFTFVTLDPPPTQ